ncbi:hypothetical protein [Pseudoduganella buxea]|uniref:Uncharacterized protein n=1 Tax=Pseudoduganella buxea TaxID=1949069 RepID=A0A6I3T025_9BURK|nr:hypothetical protein [Pseudoduganella buxea]MTV54931.1 hypothetical protein [Pseudoduganella buxea]GGC23703.1 hypothetical protein GCM10011572_51550 [Pseudoduganella buxea]
MRTTLFERISRLQTVYDKLQNASWRTEADAYYKRLYVNRIAELLSQGLPCETLADACDVLALHNITFDRIFRNAVTPLHYFFDNARERNVAVWVPGAPVLVLTANGGIQAQQYAQPVDNVVLVTPDEQDVMPASVENPTVHTGT